MQITVCHGSAPLGYMRGLHVPLAGSVLSPTTGYIAGEVPRSCSSYAFLQVLPGLDEESNKFEQTRVRRGKTGQMQVSVFLGVASCRFEWQGRLHF